MAPRLFGDVAVGAEDNGKDKKHGNMCKLKKKPNQQLEPSARPSSGRGNAQMRRITRDILRRTGTLNRHTSTILAQLVEWTFIAGKQRTSGPSQRKAPKKISPARLKRLLQNNIRPSCQACMDRRGAFDLLIGSVAKDGETLAKCASIFIEHGFPLMPVATPARMPTPLHAAAARGLHKLLNVLLAMDGAVELLQRSGPNINVWDGVRVLTVTGTAEAASTVSIEQERRKGAKKCQARQLNAA